MHLAFSQRSPNLCHHRDRLRIGSMERVHIGGRPAEQKVSRKARDERMGWEMADLIDKDGPYDPHDTTFAVGHYVEDRLVWFDFLTATVDDIMRECAIPPQEREHVKKRNKLSAQRFKEFYRGPLTGPVPLLGE